MQHKPRPAVPVGGDVLLPTHLVLARYDIVDRTLDRWLADEAYGVPAAAGDLPPAVLSAIRN
jgi:hypothetical protein